jgi:hypothetical protein
LFQIALNSYDNIIFASNTAIAKLDNVTGLVVEANVKLDLALVLLEEVNGKLDKLLCPFGNDGLNQTILRQGCDGIDQNCKDGVDECAEDQVFPTVRLTKSPPSTPFQSIDHARTFLDRFVDVSDDCAAVLDVEIDLTNGPDCTECVFEVTASDRRCVSEEESGAATSTETFILKVDSTGPAITCGFFLPQDPHSVPGGFDPCEGLSPPFPESGDFLHIDQNCFGQDFINVEIFYQIEVSTPQHAKSTLVPRATSVFDSNSFTTSPYCCYFCSRRKSVMVCFPSKFAF